MGIPSYMTVVRSKRIGRRRLLPICPVANSMMDVIWMTLFLWESYVSRSNAYGGKIAAGVPKLLILSLLPMVVMLVNMRLQVRLSMGNATVHRRLVPLCLE